jgi:hypothetical protein
MKNAVFQFRAVYRRLVILGKEVYYYKAEIPKFFASKSL